MEAVEDRVRSIVEKDWKEAATEVLAERQRTGNGDVCPLPTAVFVLQLILVVLEQLFMI